MNKTLRVLSLSLVLGVSLLYVTPVAAQNVCDPGAFCDRDGDGFIKDHRRCGDCPGDLDCNDDDPDPTNTCGGGGGGEDAKFAITFAGPLTGGNVSGGASLGEDWNENKRNVQLSGPPPPVGELDISYFVTEWTLGANCFPNALVEFDPQAILRKQKGRAEALLWFTACADTDDSCSIEIGYLLKMEGALEPGAAWPPSEAVGDSHVLTMTSWSMGGGGNQTNIDCDGEGVFPSASPPTITVTRSQ